MEEEGVEAAKREKKRRREERERERERESVEKEREREVYCQMLQLLVVPCYSMDS